MIEIRKNTREVIRIQRQEFNGHDLLNIRVFYQGGAGEMRPGKQGIAIRVDLLPELMETISRVMELEVA